jgi:ERCC4-related helicase
VTASPTSSAKTRHEMESEITRLCSLINGSIYMPQIYRQDMHDIIKRPQMKFIQTSEHPSGQLLITKIDEFFNKFLPKIFSTFTSVVNKISIKNNELKKFVNNKLKESNLEKNARQFCLIRFVSNVLNSQEIMNIMGVCRAVSYLSELINKEIENNLKNRILNDQELALILEFQYSIENLSGESDKLRELLNLFDKNNNIMIDSSRIIIFVRKRRTADLICNILCQNEAIRSAYNPKHFTGHGSGSSDGMDYHEDQQPRLENFNEGECRLLVSTNVLQEGLDVSACDKIIIFDPLWSLTELVQSRGRARHETSEFIWIGTLKQQIFFNELIKSEKVLIDLVFEYIQSTSNSKSINKASLNNQIKISKDYDRREKHNEELPIVKNKSRFRFAIQIFLNKNELNLVNSKLNSCKGYLQSEIQNDFYLASELFDTKNNFLTLNCLFESRDKRSTKSIIDELKITEQIANYLLNEFQNLISIHSSTKKASQANLNMSYASILGENGLQFGNLSTPFEYFSHRNRCEFIAVKFRIDFSFIQRLIKIFFFKNNNTNEFYKIEIDFETIDRLVVIDTVSEPDTYHVYLPLKQIPYYFIMDTTNSSDTKSTERAPALSLDNLKNIEENYLDWSRVLSIARSQEDTSNLTLKMSFSTKSNELDKFFLLKNLHALNETFVLCNRVENKTIFYSIDTFRNDFKIKYMNDFEMIYLLECFISQTDYVLNGKIDQDFLSRLLKLNPTMLTKCFEEMCAIFQSKRYHSFKGKILNDFSKPISHDFDLFFF